LADFPPEEEGEWEVRVPRLDLEDIWSDATLPSSCKGDGNAAGADLSLASTQEQQISCDKEPNPPPPPDDMIYSDRYRRTVNNEQGLSSVRSIGCDTGDLGALPRTTNERWQQGWGGGDVQTSLSCRQSADVAGQEEDQLSHATIRRAYSVDHMAEINNILRSL
jgi:hypothetical protein